MLQNYEKMYNRVQRRDESVYVYFRDEMRMCRRLKLNEVETKKMLYVGLQSRNICTSLMSKPCVSECDLMAELRDFIQVEDERKERFGTSSIRPRTNYKTVDKRGNQNVKPTTESITDTGRQDRELRDLVVIIVRYMSRDFPQPRKTYKCNKCQAEGHTAKYCTFKTPDVSLIEKSKPGKLVYLDPDMEPVNRLVDTGKTYCIITQSTALKYNLTVKPKTVNMYVYGNVQSVTSYGETEVFIRIDNLAERVTLLIVDDRLQNHKIIIGRTFIDRNDVSFIKTLGELKFTNGMIFSRM